MKLICLIVLVASLNTHAQSTSQATDNTKFTIDFEYWEGCETGESPCVPLEFKRNTLLDSIVLIMPCGGTATSVKLFEVGSEKPISTISISYNECPPTFDLTGLPDGVYSAFMIACGLGGEVKFNLITE